jgi:Cysteine rich repeat
MTQTSIKQNEGRRVEKGNDSVLRHIALISAFACMSFASAAFAQDAQPHRGACRADAEKLCAGVEHGGGRILNCLAAQKDKLSDDCRKSVENRGK